ncbi:hypothetical protein CAEBREN_25839 [Caenorhabditis brenneri]|uniref:RNA-directed DNA polymerase n=1 Tax=Caenorhabditis brenneri TaxID=135651 RepID=G0MBW5_CAEBE|nr:hypothetical protein CAEBREN_25839 [Caenorhabditis brenneri]
MATLEEQIANLTQAVAALAQLQTQQAQAQAQAQAPTATGAPRLFDQIANRIPQFTYDPEVDKTFDLWYARYKDVINKDGQNLNDEEKTRIVLSKLSDPNYTFYSNRLLPKNPTDFTYTETVDQLKKTFKSTSSIFKKRQDFLRLEYDGTNLEEYTGTVLQKFTASEFKKMSDDQVCCMVWISGLRDTSLNDMRTKALQAMEAKPEITLLELETEVKRLMDIRADSKAIASPTTGINQVRRHQPKKEFSSKFDKPPPSPCPGCKGSHWLKDCPKPKIECRKCKKTGHIEKNCRVNSWSQESKVNSIIVGAATTPGANRIYRTLQINGKPIKMQLDTGADLTLISEADWKKLGQPTLNKPTISIRSANHQPIEVKGWFSCTVTIGNDEKPLKAHVADTETLLGTDWMAQDHQLWNLLNSSQQINSVGSPTGSACAYLDSVREQLQKSLEQEYPQVFHAGLGKCTKLKAEIRLKPDAKPVFRKARPVPYATLAAVSDELDRLTTQGVLAPVDHSSWAAPIVIVKKKNGSIRMCADYSTGLNDSIEQHRHPLPTAEDIFTIINGGKFFTQIDLAEAYLQIELDDQSKNLLSINTHKGIYQFQRLPFGVKSAPGIFQQVMDQLVNGIEGVSAYLDDIIITGGTIEEHNIRLKKVMCRINEFGMRMKLEKCKFLMEEIRFLGFIVDKNGRRPDPEKIAAIKDMPAPKDVTQVKSFLGLIQFYGAFVKHLFRLRPPLDALTKKDTPFKWSRDCQHAFDKIKEALQSDLLLTHFDPTKPIIVAADASKDGIGGVLLHQYPDGSQKAVFHISKALNKAQQNYSQIEKEGFALITAVTKFHKYLHGRFFTLKTDHKPLLSIFGDKKGVPVYSANRLQRWATILLNYQFNIEYVNTLAFGQADALSRLIAENTNNLEHEDQVIAQIETDVVDTLEHGCQQLPVSAHIIRQFSKKDPTLQAVYKFVKSGHWPRSIPKDTPLRDFYNRRGDLYIVHKCVMFGERIIIPTKLRNRVLRMLHRAHPGIVRMKKLARSFVYWPSIDSEIEKIVKSCDQCAAVAKDPTKNTLCSWPLTTAPWQRVHVDYAGPLNGKYYLVMVDSYSKWPEVHMTSSISTSATVKLFQQTFSQFGVPETLVTDNGPQFTSNAFNNFCVAQGITHVRSPPYHPQSNGQAERFVDSLKRALGKLKGEETDDAALKLFLQSYRSTPCDSSPNQASPAENFIGRRIRTFLNQLLPTADPISSDRNESMELQFNRHHGARTKEFGPTEKVYVKDYRNLSTPTWIPGTILRRIGQTLYSVRVDGNLSWKRHANQLRPRGSSPLTDTPMDMIDSPQNLDESQTRADSDVSSVPSPVPVTCPVPTTTTPSPAVPRRSSRATGPPSRLVMDPTKKTYTPLH